MNKQQLAARIWESANKMRSKIEANEYKDYILGFIFYKFLSEKEVKYLKENDWTDEYLSELTEEDTETVESIQKNLGYFISYENLFSTWLEKDRDFSVQNVRDALSAFSRLINPAHKKVFEGVFDTLQTGLSKLGDSAASQSKSISDLIQLIRDIPMDGKQGYDVLGFIYEYLIEKFAANAGKKAGEFYTPHEVSLLMSEIVANHLKDRDKIEIYDPTSGSGSLLINIGKSASKYISGENKVKYYAQELKQNTYNLTRMNLVMRGIEADNIVTRNGDTLEDDWPYFDENDPIGSYNPLYVDAVVSNPPYSQAWNPVDKETDPRYAGYGIAPKGKADYAFLLHDLYHIKPDGIMTIVLPHGVLFRGGEEGEIRKNLIEKNKIDTIIGLPANIFYGTGIPTIIMVLKQKRINNDILIIDASKGFMKDGKNNKLRASDIKRIVDVVTARESVCKFSRVVGRDEIRKNDYNLNIPRYVDSSEEAESWDIYASMFGGLPISEIDKLDKYWKAFPLLREELFENSSKGYCQLARNDIKKSIKEHSDVKNFEKKFQKAFQSFDKYLYDKLIVNINESSILKSEEMLSEEMFKRLHTLIANLDIKEEANWDWFILLVAKTGMRFSEALAITPADFDFSRQTLSISKTWDYKGEGGFLPTKNKSSVRKIQIDWQIVVKFSELVKGLPDDKPIFVGKSKIYNSTVNDILTRHCKKCGISEISIHGLRHTHASLLLFAGVSIASVARRLGHASMTTTQKTYLHIIQELENKDVDLVMRTLSGL